MRTKFAGLLRAAVLLLTGGVCFAQSVPYTKEVEGRPPEEEFGIRPADVRPPAADPHDLNGGYQQLEEGGPERNFNTDIVTQCTPAIEIGARAYPQFIVQTPGRITLIEEANHIVRRVYLDRDFPAQIAPSYAGYSIGRWEKDTLVVVTRGLKSTDVAGDPRFGSVTEVVEKYRKQRDGGVKVHAEITGMDKRGKKLTSRRSATLVWRPDFKLMEYICEDGAR